MNNIIDCCCPMQVCHIIGPGVTEPTEQTEVQGDQEPTGDADAPSLERK